MDKSAARKAAFATRATAHAAGQGAASAYLGTLLAQYRGKVVSGYVPIRSEIDPLPAMAAYDGTVCVPVIMGKARPLHFLGWTPETELVPGEFGALIPASGDWLVPQVLIVPLLAFDARGYRLGYGGGFYDRTLEGLRAAGDVVAIGFAYAAQELPQVPIEPTDQRLDWIVTERGARAVPG